MAINIGVNFNGKHIVHPGAYSRINTDGMRLGGSSGLRTIVFIGSAQGGEPHKVLWMNNPNEAKQVLRGGDLLKAGELAWSPTGDGNGASLIGFLRVEDAKQAELVKEGLKLVSKDWGEYTNRIQAKLEDGTIAESKRLVVYHFEDNVQEIYDNIGPIFKVKYDGNEEYASISVEPDENGKAKCISIKVGADADSANEIISYDLTSGQFNEVIKVVYDLNERPDFTATMIPYNKGIASAELDIVSDQDIKEEYTVKAYAGDLIHQTRFSNLFVPVIDDYSKFPENFGYTYFTGGSDGEVPSSWAEIMNDALYGEGIDMVVPLTGDEAIHAEVARFVEFQSNNERSEMIAFYGGNLGEPVEKAVSRALTLNSSRAVLCYPGIMRSAGRDQVETLPPYFTGALVAGCVAGADVGDPVTLQYVNLIGLEKVLTSAEIKRLIEGGVTTIEFVRQANHRGYRIAQGITTYQSDNNPVYREISVRTMADLLSKELRERLESRFVGGKGTLQTGELVKNEVQSFLDEKVREEWIVKYDPDIIVRMIGDHIEVEYRAMPVNVVNFVLITTNFYQEVLEF